MAMSKAKKANFHQKIMKDWGDIYSVEQYQRRVMNEDTVVANVQGGTWIDCKEGFSGYLDDYDYQDDDGSPRFSVNKISYELQKSYGTYLNMRPEISVSPDGNGATREGAEALQAAIRHVEQQSDADNAYDSAFNANQTCGFGAWRIITEYKDDSFNQEMFIDAIPDAVNTLFFDALSKPQILNQDARHLFYIEHMSLEKHKERWPKAKLSSFPSIADLEKGTKIESAWYKSNSVSVAQYWYKESYKVRLAELVDGTTIELSNKEEESREDIALYSTGKPKVRMQERNRVKMVMVNGIEILEGPFDFPSPYFPFIPDYGIITTVQGTNYIRGRVRLAKDAQRIDDYAVSKFIETTAIQPEQPIVVQAEMIDGFESEWGAQPLPPVIRYNPVENGAQVPFRMESAQISPALVQQITQAERDIQAAMGVVNDQAIHDVSNVSYRSQITQSNLGTAVNRDNHRKAVELSGKIVASLAPAIYSENQVISFIGAEGEPKEIEINKPVRDPMTTEMVVENDMSRGNYKVTAIAGLDGVTQKAELSEKLTQLTINNPDLAAQTADIQADLLDAPKHVRDKLTKRVRKMMISQGLDTPTPEEAKDLEIDMAAVQQQKIATEKANQALIQAEQRLTQAKAVEAEENAANKAADTDKKVAESQQTLIENRKLILEQLQMKLQGGIALTENDLLLLYGTTEVALDDLSDSVQERQEMERMISGQIQALQLLQSSQTQAPTNRSPEQSIQMIQFENMQR